MFTLALSRSTEGFRSLAEFTKETSRNKRHPKNPIIIHFVFRIQHILNVFEEGEEFFDKEE